MASKTKTLGEILNEYSEYLTLLPSNKIKCSVTNHEMSARCDVVTAHIQGKKFKKALNMTSRSSCLISLNTVITSSSSTVPLPVST